MNGFKSFVLGEDAYPDWFVALSKAGKVEYTTNDLGKLLSVKVYTNTGAIRVKAGEVIADTGETIIKINKAVLEQYGK